MNQRVNLAGLKRLDTIPQASERAMRNSQPIEHILGGRSSDDADANGDRSPMLCIVPRNCLVVSADVMPAVNTAIATIEATIQKIATMRPATVCG
jgi:hypothetical protein